MLTRIFIFTVLITGLVSLSAQQNDSVSIPARIILYGEGVSNHFTAAPHHHLYSHANVSADLFLHATKKKRLHFYGQIGIGWANITYRGIEWEGDSLIGPLFPGNNWVNAAGLKSGFHMITGRKAHHLEAGIGIFMGKTTRNSRGNFLWLPMLSIGYRYQPLKGGLLFRAFLDFTALGIGVGYAFPSKR